jgi:hypothetical protein
MASNRQSVTPGGSGTMWRLTSVAGGIASSVAAGQSTWEHVKDAVRDAWDRVTGHRASSEDRGTARSTY